MIRTTSPSTTGLPRAVTSMRTPSIQAGPIGSAGSAAAKTAEDLHIEGLGIAFHHLARQSDEKKQQTAQGEAGDEELQFCALEVSPAGHVLRRRTFSGPRRGGTGRRAIPQHDGRHVVMGARIAGEITKRREQGVEDVLRRPIEHVAYRRHDAIFAKLLARRIRRLADAIAIEDNSVATLQADLTQLEHGLRKCADQRAASLEADHLSPRREQQRRVLPGIAILEAAVGCERA